MAEVDWVTPAPRSRPATAAGAAVLPRQVRERGFDTLLRVGAIRRGGFESASSDSSLERGRRFWGRSASAAASDGADSESTPIGEGVGRLGDCEETAGETARGRAGGAQIGAL